MAKQEVGLKIDVDVKSVGNMKQELRAATQELIAVNEKFGATSSQAVAAAKRVASLKDAIGDAKALADTFNPDKKFVALGGAVQGAVAGFSALQGAIGLFGDESKEVEKVLLKVQSAMALQQGISGIAGAMDSFKLLAGTIKTQVVAAFTTLRGAMMATGIGLITSAVAFLVANFDSVKKTLGELFPVLKGTGDLMDRLKQIAMGVGNAILQFLAAPVSALIKIFQGDFKGAIDSFKNGFAFVKNFREGEKKEIESQAAEAEEARQKELEKQKAANDKKLAEQRRINEELRKEREAAEKQYNDFIKAENEKRLLSTMSQNEKELYELRKKFAAQYEIAKKYGFDTKQLNQLQFKEGLDLVNKSTAEDTKVTIDANAKKLGDFTAMVPKMATVQTTITANDQAESKARITISELENQTRIANAQFAADQLSAIAQLAGQDTAAGKALSIAAATISTYLSAQKAYESQFKPVAIVDSPIRGAIAAAVAVATGIANIRKIAAVQVPSRGGGGGGKGGATGISTSAPMVPQLTPQVQATQVNTAAVNQMGNRAARAYVLNSDIQNEQQRNAYIERNASLG